MGDGWEGESVVSDHETTVEDMYRCCDDAGEPDDPEDPYGGPDMGYEGVDEMRDQFDREVGSPCCVRATVRARRGVVKLTLKIPRACVWCRRSRLGRLRRLCACRHGNG